MFVKKCNDGDYYVCKRNMCKHASKVGGVSNKKGSYRNWFFIKSENTPGSYIGVLTFNKIIFPQEFLGKRIRLKVEVLK